MRRFLPVSSAFLHQGERIYTPAARSCGTRERRQKSVDTAECSPAQDRTKARYGQDARPGADSRRAVGRLASAGRPRPACVLRAWYAGADERSVTPPGGGAPGLLSPTRALRCPSTQRARSARWSPMASIRAATSAATPARRYRGWYSCRVRGRRPSARIRGCPSAGIATE